MKTKWMALMTIAGAVNLLWVGVHAQQPQQESGDSPSVKLVQAIGCVENDGSDWFLLNASTPSETERPFMSNEETEEAQVASLGSNRFQLIGVGEFLDVDGLLAQPERAQIIGAEDANATGQLAAGRKVSVKGLFIENADPKRINLTSVIRLDESCS